MGMNDISIKYGIDTSNDYLVVVHFGMMREGEERQLVSNLMDVFPRNSVYTVPQPHIKVFPTNYYSQVLPKASIGHIVYLVGCHVAYKINRSIPIH